MEAVYKHTIYTVCAHAVKSIDHSQSFEKTKDAIRRRLGLQVPCCGRIKLIPDKSYKLSVAYAEAKVRLEIIKPLKEDDEPGAILPKRAGTNCNFGVHEAGHEREFNEAAYLRLGWCPSCEERLKRAKNYGHHRNLNPRDNHIIENFWAWRTYAPPTGSFKTEDMPFAVLDMRAEYPYKKNDATTLTDVHLRGLHHHLKEKATGEWKWSSFFNGPKFNKDMVPRLLDRHDERTGQCYVPREEYAILFTLYEIQPYKLISEHEEHEYDYGVETPGKVNATILFGVKKTLKLYGKDIR